MSDVSALVRLTMLSGIVLIASPVRAESILPPPAPAVPPSIARIGTPAPSVIRSMKHHAWVWHRAAPSSLPLLPGGAKHPKAFAPYAIGIPTQ